jgi:hypothetical protein
METFGAAEGGARLGDGGFEILLRAGFDLDLGNFSDHGGLPLMGISVSNAAARKEKAPFGASSFQIVQELS